MSANLVVDLQATCMAFPSVPSPAVAADGGLLITSGGAISSLSGVLVGDIVNLGNADTWCNVYVTGFGFGSGPLIIGVQTSTSTASGTFTDPTSGLAALPSVFSSGGQLIIGSGPGLQLGVYGSGVSGQYILSGFTCFAGFQRPGQFARLNINSGFFDGVVKAGFISNLRTTGSGGGYSPSPSSGAVSV